MDSKVPVVIIVAIIAMGVLLWGIWAVRMAGGIDPERAKTLAEEAERECVLEGYGTDACKQLVGKNHRDCLEAAKPDSEGPSLDQKPYIECMKEAFAETAGGEEKEEKEKDEAKSSGEQGESETEDVGGGDAEADSETAGDAGREDAP